MKTKTYKKITFKEAKTIMMKVKRYKLFTDWYFDIETSEEQVFTVRGKPKPYDQQVCNLTVYWSAI